MNCRSVLCLTVLGILAACATDSKPQGYVGSLGSTQNDVRFADGDTSLIDLCGSYEIGSDARAGTYVGFWREGVKDALQTAVIVEKVDASGKAQVLYSHGHYVPWGIDYSECERFAGSFTDDDTLIVDFRDGRKGTFEFFAAGRVSGTYSSSTGLSRGSFSRI